MPPPSVIEAYDRLVPGAAQMMWQNFDSQSSHRRELEKSVVSGSERRADRGQLIVAALVGLAMTFGLVIALTKDAKVGGTVIVGVMISGVALYFVGGHRPPEGRRSGSKDEP